MSSGEDTEVNEEDRQLDDAKDGDENTVIKVKENLIKKAKDQSDGLNHTVVLEQSNIDSRIMQQFNVSNGEFLPFNLKSTTLLNSN